MLGLGSAARRLVRDSGWHRHEAARVHVALGKNAKAEDPKEGQARAGGSQERAVRELSSPWTWAAVGLREGPPALERKLWKLRGWGGSWGQGGGGCRLL